jgi:hypothetical protein
MSVLLSPIGNGFQFLTTTGLPLNGGLIYTYQAGSSTPLATYSDNAGLVPNANPIVLGVDGRPATEIWLTYGFSYKFILCDSNNNVIQTYDNLYGILQTAPSASGSIPSGLIAIWSGSTGSIPSGWVLCNGQNGTPDLRNSFIIGAGSTYAVGATGGYTDTTLPSHTHGATSSSTATSTAVSTANTSSNSVVTDPGHYHSPASPATFFYTNNAGSNYTGGATGFGGTATTAIAYTGISVTTYSTTDVGTSVSTTVGTTTSIASAGTTPTGTNLPPFYALAFIMKS